MRSGKMLDIPNRYKNITPSKKSRRWIIPLSITSDLLPVAVGVLLVIFFPLLKVWWANLLGILVAFVGVYRIIYHVMMGVGIHKAVVKKGVTSVWDLISELAFKTPSDVLSVLYRQIKHGYLIGYGVKDLKVYKVEKK